MIYVYRKKPSNGARDLAEELCLAGVRARRVRRPPTLTASDKVICWGSPMMGARANVLNGGAYDNKLNDALVLKAAGVATIEAHRARPARPEPIYFELPGGSITQSDAAALIENLQVFMSVMEPAPVTWIGRRYHHVGGNDLLNPPSTPDYWVKKESIVEEYRIHSFMGKSIRAGKKIPRENAHPWVRSFDGNWIIAYEGFKSSREMRELAAAACNALELDFGAVDLGRLSDGRLIVLEVNRAPGIEGNTTTAYAEAISKWAEGHEE